MKTKIILSIFAMLFSFASISQDSTGTVHKTTHVRVSNNGATVKHTVKKKKHYRTRRHTTYRRPANSRTTTITTTTTQTKK